MERARLPGFYACRLLARNYARRGAAVAAGRVICSHDYRESNYAPPRAETRRGYFCMYFPRRSRGLISLFVSAKMMIGHLKRLQSSRSRSRPVKRPADEIFKAREGTEREDDQAAFRRDPFNERLNWKNKGGFSRSPFFANNYYSARNRTLN